MNMTVRIVLPKETIKILKMFGDISTVTNEILTLAERNEIDIFGLESMSKAEQTSKVTIHIHNQWYIDIVKDDSSRYFSLSKALRYFVDNEIYAELGWKITSNLQEEQLATIKDAIDLYRAAAIILVVSKRTQATSKLAELGNKIIDIANELKQLAKSKWGIMNEIYAITRTFLTKHTDEDIAQELSSKLPDKICSYIVKKYANEDNKLFCKFRICDKKKFVNLDSRSYA